MPTIHILGSGGGVVELSLPLSEAVAEQIEKGYARIVKADGTPIDEADRPVDAPALQGTRPALSATKAAWVSWAVFNGAVPDEADASSKQDLIEKYGTAQPDTGDSEPNTGETEATE